MAANEKLPRGLRNCNPGNIRRSRDRWKGLRPVQEDKEFFQFISMAYGYRAMARILLNYQRKYKLDTVRKIINRWAPTNENHTELYVAFVARKMDVEPDRVISTENATVLTKLCSAIAQYENGRTPVPMDVEQGVRMALNI